ncbi:MAG: nucleotide sugar dehydrogenase [Planctomycetes bacterium]|nr:nucleotide sugar dehydrogenase [Planctomycetota bacterium]
MPRTSTRTALPTSCEPVALPGGEREFDGELRARIADRSARVGVIGLGAVGLPLAEAFLEAGFRVEGYDSDAQRVAELTRGLNPLEHLAPGMVQRMRACGRFEPSADESRLAELDVALVCVPTPLDSRGAPDLGCVRAAARMLAQRLPAGALIVLESTTWPGTTREVLGEILRAHGRAPGEDLLLAYSPEREDPGREGARTATIPKLVGGTCERSRRAAAELYRAAVREVHEVSSAEIAEAAKLFENVFRAVNIALVNELKLVLERAGIDVWETLAAAGTKPFGFQRFAPGPGTGGQCIPVDPRYYAAFAQALGMRARLVEEADALNRAMPAHVVERTRAALGSRGTSLEGARVLVLGVAYKKDVDITSESPALEILRLFAAGGAEVAYSDPHVEELAPSGLRSRELDARALESSDAVVLVTDHSRFDYALVARHARLVVDTRRAFAERGLAHANVVGA